MPVEKHDLMHEFPEYRAKIHDLKAHDPNFAKLFASYHEADQLIHRIETGVENTSDDFLEERKKERVYLKDELYRMLREA